MTRLRVLSGVVSVILGLVAIQGCAVGAGSHVSGRVIDADTGEPISGAYVYARSGYYKCGPFELGGCGCIDVDAALTRTNKKGYYDFDKKFDFGGTFFSDRFGTVTVYKENYISPKTNIDYSRYEDPGPVPPNFHDLYHEYFFGSGRYTKDYAKFSIKSKSGLFQLEKTKIKKLTNMPNKTPRLVYLVNVINSRGGPACIEVASDRAKNVSRRFDNILLKDASREVNTPTDRKLFTDYFDS